MQPAAFSGGKLLCWSLGNLSSFQGTLITQHFPSKDSVSFAYNQLARFLSGIRVEACDLNACILHVSKTSITQVTQRRSVAMEHFASLR